jgi:hypothetical protein
MPLTILPIPGRIEVKEAREKRNEWKGRFVDELRPFFDVWLDKDVSVTRVLEEITVPYFPSYSFGEELPVLHESLTAPGNLARSYATISRILEQDFQKIGSLVGARAVDASIEMHDKRLNDRQKRILSHVSETGSVTSGWCRNILGVAYDTANRDLRELIKLGLLRRTGAGRSTIYVEAASTKKA